MQYSPIRFTLLLLAFLSLTSFSQPNQSQKVRVTLRYITCKAVDDSGPAEEIYGKVWALNLAPYKTAETARQYFEKDEVLKVGNGGGKIWSTDRDHYIALKKGETRQINKSVEIICSAPGKIIVLGDLDERDGGGNPDDRLASAGSLVYKVVDLSTFSDAAVVELIFKSGGTDVRVEVALKKI